VKIHFWKMHGAANDFVLVDDRKLQFPSRDRRWIASVSARRTGVGCEGVILIQPSRTANFRMRFFNPDGSEAEMCGNGARCVARLAFEIGAAPRDMTIQTIAGTLSARVLGKDRVELVMTDPSDWRTGCSLNIGRRRLRYDFVNTGVPHAVVVVRDLDAVDVATLGAAIRRHTDFAPRGTNADFISPAGAGSIRIRTYERGVEAETLACGTGIVAGALVAARNGLATPPVRVRAASGDTLTVNFSRSGETFENVTLQGPAVHVFEGDLTYAK